MKAFYNDHDPFCCAWLSNLMDDGLITPGDIDDRSIEDLDPADLGGYERVHLFAGIGGWDHALNLAGWQGQVWTGSCPCQPLSGAGLRKGHADERHLWPAFHRLIAECRPAVVLGEQVASPLGREWLAGVRLDLEALVYACGAADLCAAGAGEKAKGRVDYEDNTFAWQPIVVGAPHIRQRLFWVAQSESQQHDGLGHMGRGRGKSANGGTDGRLADADGGRHYRTHETATPITDKDGPENRVSVGVRGRVGQQPQDSGAGGVGISNGAGPQPRQQAAEATRHRSPTEPAGDVRGVGNASGAGPQERERNGRIQREALESHARETAVSRGNAGHWSNTVWLECSDGKHRRVPADETGQPEPALFPLADAGAIRNRVGTLRGAGNAIVSQVAAEFIAAYREATA